MVMANPNPNPSYSDVNPNDDRKVRVVEIYTHFGAHGRSDFINSRLRKESGLDT